MYALQDIRERIANRNISRVHHRHVNTGEHVNLYLIRSHMNADAHQVSERYNITLLQKNQTTYGKNKEERNNNCLQCHFLSLFLIKPTHDR